jgi:hypothetical protein
VTRYVLDIDDSQWKADHLPRVLRTTESEWLNELACQVEIQIAGVERPLIVLDMKGMSPTPILTGFLREQGYDWLASQIEAQTEPARIPEPGLWGVVEASSKWFDGRREYVRIRPTLGTKGEWHGEHGAAEWSVLIDPILIREGVES